MLIVAVVRWATHLVARLAAWREAGRRQPWPPELLDLDRRASVAMTMCTCGHIWHRHEHPHVSTGCDACACSRFRPAQRPEGQTGAPRNP